MSRFLQVLMPHIIYLVTWPLISISRHKFMLMKVSASRQVPSKAANALQQIVLSSSKFKELLQVLREKRPPQSNVQPAPLQHDPIVPFDQPIMTKVNLEEPENDQQRKEPVRQSENVGKVILLEEASPLELICPTKDNTIKLPSSQTQLHQSILTPRKQCLLPLKPKNTFESDKNIGRRLQQLPPAIPSDITPSPSSPIKDAVGWNVTTERQEAVLGQSQITQLAACSPNSTQHYSAFGGISTDLKMYSDPLIPSEHKINAEEDIPNSLPLGSERDDESQNSKRATWNKRIITPQSLLGHNVGRNKSGEPTFNRSGTVSFMEKPQPRGHNSALERPIVRPKVSNFWSSAQQLPTQSIRKEANTGPKLPTQYRLNRKVQRMRRAQPIYAPLKDISQNAVLSALQQFDYQLDQQSNQAELQAFFEGLLSKLGIDINFPYMKKFKNGVFYGHPPDECGKHEGFLYFYDGRISYGQFQGAVRHGHCVEVGPDILYKGEFKQGKKQGRFLIKKKDLEYVGCLEDGLYHGEGRLTTSDRVYQGFFENGVKHGYGKQINLRTGLTFQGIFIEGALQHRTKQASYYERNRSSDRFGHSNQPIFNQSKLKAYDSRLQEDGISFGANNRRASERTNHGRSKIGFYSSRDGMSPGDENPQSLSTATESPLPQPTFYKLIQS